MGKRHTRLISTKALVGKLSIQTMSYGLQAFLQLGTMMILARLLSRRDFGIFAIALGIRYFALTLSEAGIGSAVIQRKDVDAAFRSTAFWLSTAISSVFTIAFFVLAPFFADFNNEPVVRDVVRVISISFLLNGFGAVPRSVLTRDLAFGKLMIAEVVPLVFGNLGLGVFLAVRGYGAWALVWGMVGTGLLRVVLLFGLSGFRPQMVFSMASLRQILGFSIGISLARVFSPISQHADKYLLGNLMSVSILGGISRVVELVRMLALYCGHVLDTVAFPLISQVQDDLSRVRGAYTRLIDGVCAMSPFVIVMAYFFARDIILFVLGADWTDLTPVFQVFSLTFLFLLLVRINDCLLRSLGRVYVIAGLKCIGAVCSVSAILISYRYGSVGLAWGIVFANGLMALVGIVTCSHLLGEGALRYVGYGARSVMRMVLLFGLLTLVSKGVGIYPALPYGLALSLRVVLSSSVVLLLIVVFPSVLGRQAREVLAVILERCLGPANVLACRFASQV